MYMINQYKIVWVASCIKKYKNSICNSNWHVYHCLTWDLMIIKTEFKCSNIIEYIINGTINPDLSSYVKT